MAFTINNVADHKQVNGTLVALTDTEKQTLVDAWNAPDTRPYKQKRQEAYASTGDQLDMQYWDSVNDTTTWKDHVASVKAQFPKV